MLISLSLSLSLHNNYNAKSTLCNAINYNSKIVFFLRNWNRLLSCKNNAITKLKCIHTIFVVCSCKIELCQGSSTIINKFYIVKQFKNKQIKLHWHVYESEEFLFIEHLSKRQQIIIYQCFKCIIRGHCELSKVEIT